MRQLRSLFLMLMTFETATLFAETSSYKPAIQVLFKSALKGREKSKFDGSVVLQVSTVIGAAVKSQREESGWSEGVAIWVAVLIVSFVGEQPYLPEMLPFMSQAKLLSS